MRNLLGSKMFGTALAITAHAAAQVSKSSKADEKLADGFNSNGLIISYRVVTPPKDKTWKAFKIPVVDATLSPDNRILAKRIIKASNRGSKYIPGR